MLARPLPSHWKAAQRVMRYLLLSPSAHVRYSRHTGSETPKYDIEVYSDADFAGESRTRKSTSGRLVFVFGNLVSWKAKSQSGVALSSCESEYVAMADAVKDVMYVKQLLSFFGFANPTAVVYGDNASTVKIVRKEAAMTRTRHVDIKLKFLIHQANIEAIQFLWVSTGDMWADMMTKGLGASKLNRLKPRTLAGLDK
jgi:hypothetical protein